jgi:hypothetical protein
MKNVILFLWLIPFVSCKQTAKTKSEIVTAPILSSRKEMSSEEVYRKSYDITDLKSYNDTSKFIGRFGVEIYSDLTIIELTEHLNGIILCVKQPVEQIDNFNRVDSVHSLAFNQLCYNYSDSEAQTIKSQFIRYNNHRELRDICKGCIRHSRSWIEIFDHGKYSYYERDSFIVADKTFIDFLTSKVHISPKNGYKINN